MSNQIKLTFLGDADSLAKATKRSDDALTTMNKAAGKSQQELAAASKSSDEMTTRIGHLGSAVSGASDALDAIGGSLQAVVDLQQAGAERAAKLARATLDARSAQQDYNQALRDGARAQLDAHQAELDYEAALLDGEEAQKALNEAIREHGRNSIEARRAALELKQANQDAASAQEDGRQALEDQKRATIDSATAMQDLADAMREAKPPELAKWAQDVQTFAPLVTAFVGVIGLATTAQWLWNAALWASPITWIVLAVAAFAGIMIYLATQTTVFQDTWKVVWGFLKGVGAWFAGPFTDFFVRGYQLVKFGLDWLWDNVKRTVGNLKAVFSQVVDFIVSPFRTAFNLVSTIWNNTIGRLSWTVPSWVPGIGGNTISAPKLPHFHRGGQVSGALGAETLAVLQAGERVTPMGGGGHSEPLLLGSDGSDMGDFLISQLRKAIARRGGDASRVLSNKRG